MYKDTILQSYILINKNGKYYAIQGGFYARKISKDEISEIQDLNKKRVLDAFGEDKCSFFDDSYNCSSNYELADGEWTISVKNDGRVRVAGYDSFCVIDKLGTSGCGVTPQ